MPVQHLIVLLRDPRPKHQVQSRLPHIFDVFPVASPARQVAIKRDIIALQAGGVRAATAYTPESALDGRALRAIDGVAEPEDSERLAAPRALEADSSRKDTRSAAA